MAALVAGVLEIAVVFGLASFDEGVETDVAAAVVEVTGFFTTTLVVVDGVLAAEVVVDVTGSFLDVVLVSFALDDSLG